MQGYARDELPPLHEHCKQNDAAKVLELLAARADVNAPHGTFRWMPLHQAAGEDSCRCCEVLLEAKADLDALASDRETPLHLAAQMGAEQTIRLLATARANVNAVSDEGETPLLVAVQHLGGKALGHIAALVELRADVTKRDNDGNNAFALARVMTNRGDEIMKVLSQGGEADVEAVDPTAGCTSAELEQVLSAACQKGQVDIVKKLLQMLPSQEVASAASRSMVAAAAAGNVEVADVLLASGASLHASSDDQGTFPLLAAADEGATRMLRWLLSKSADVKAVSNNGATALMAAASRGSTDGVSLLLGAKAEADQQANNGWTALMFASHTGRLEVTKSLLDAKAGISLKNSDGGSARSLAADSGHSDLVKILDTRTRLSARRAKVDQSTDDRAAVSKEDTRDLDDLLAGLGEPSSSAGSKKSSQASKASKKVKATKHTVEEPQALNETEVKAKTRSTVKAMASSTDEKQKGTAEVQKKIEAIRSRLKELAAKQAELDVEKKTLRKELEALEATS